MLNALYRYAIRENLVLPAGYVKKTIRAYVSLGADGRFLGVIPGDADKVPCPDIGSMANSGEKCNVLAEKRSILFSGCPVRSSPRRAAFDHLPEGNGGRKGLCCRFHRTGPDESG